MKRSYFSILFFLCLVVPVTTTLVLSHYQKKQVRREVKWKIIAGIDREELVLLKFTEQEKQTQLKWKHSKEFEYKAEMYDIVETENVGDTTYYWCWWDCEETALNQKLNEMVSFLFGNSPKKTKSQQQLFSFYKSLYFVQLLNKELFIATNINKKYFIESIDYLSVNQSPAIPPPKLS